MKTSIQRLLPVAAALAFVTAIAPAHADIILGGGSDRSVCPDPTFGACYIGVDGSRTAQLPQDSSGTYTLVGLGVQSSELGAVTFPMGAPNSGAPSGQLTLLSGSTLNIAGSVTDPTRVYDVSLIVGLGNNSTGSLFVNAGRVLTPIMLIGEQDTRRSNGTVTVANGGTITAGFDAASAQSLVPGLSGISVGRGAGSTGALYIQNVGSSVSTTGSSISFGRAGTADVQVTNGATLSSFGSIYGSTADPAGSSSIFVSGTGSVLSVGAGGNVLVGIATTGAGLNLGYDATSTAHGTSTLNVTNDARVLGNVVVGAGGTLRGSGRVVGNVTNLGGTVSPGNSPGTLHVQGNFVMDGGLYLVEIAGTGPTMTDLIDVSGTASLSNATVLFSFIDGFAPSAGFSFDFLQAGLGLTTSNLTFQTQGLLPGFEFATTNVNGNFVFTARTAGTAVPEPETMPLVLIGLLGAALLARRSKKVAVRIATA